MLVTSSPRFALLLSIPLITVVCFIQGVHRQEDHQAVRAVQRIMEYR